MAQGQIHNVRLVGLAACVPPARVKNDELDLLAPDERAKLIAHTGIQERRIASATTTTADLCAFAGQNLLDRLGWQASEVELLVFVSQTPDYLIPATAPLLQQRLGLPRTAMCFDIVLGCSGYVYGLSVAASLVSSLGLRKALLLVGDTSSKVVSTEDKSTLPIFGDAGSATALVYDESAPALWASHYTDGSGAEAIMAKASGWRQPPGPETWQLKEHGPGICRADVHMGMDGIAVLGFTLREVPLAVRSLMARAGWTVEDTQGLVLHQANRLINEQLRQKLGFPPEKCPSSLELYGNTSSATIPLTLASAWSQRLESEAMKLLLCGFGVGLSWAAIALETQGLVCTGVLEYVE